MHYAFNENHPFPPKGNRHVIFYAGAVNPRCYPDMEGYTHRAARRGMGSRDWAAIADENIGAGTEAVITRIEGNALRVQRKSPVQTERK